MSIQLPQIIKSPSDNREYLLIKLEKNDMEILLISDPLTEMSSASVNVNAGQLNDPKDREGKMQKKRKKPN